MKLSNDKLSFFSSLSKVYGSVSHKLWQPKQFSRKGKIQDTGYMILIGTSVSIILYFILISAYGANGAAIASSIGYCITSIACIIRSKIVFGLKIPELFLLQKNDVNWLWNKIKK